MFPSESGAHAWMDSVTKGIIVDRLSTQSTDCMSDAEQGAAERGREGGRERADRSIVHCTSERLYTCTLRGWKEDEGDVH